MRAIGMALVMAVAACGGGGGGGECEFLTEPSGDGCVARDGVTISVARLLLRDTAGAITAAASVSACFQRATGAPVFDPVVLADDGGCVVKQSSSNTAAWETWAAPAVGTLSIEGGGLDAEFAPSGGAGCFEVSVASAAIFSGGEVFTVSSTGGPEFDAFSVGGIAPPVVTETEIPGTISPGQDFTLSWESGRADAFVFASNGTQFIEIACDDASDTITISGALTAHIPGDATVAAGVVRYRTSRTETDQGLVDLTIGAIFYQDVTLL